MTAQVIDFIPNENSADVDFVELIGQYVCSLRNNGQILLENSFIKDGDKYSLYVTTPKPDSLDERFGSVYVKRDRAELDNYCTVTVRRIGQNVYSDEYCTCDTRSAMEMETYDVDIDSVFICCDCGKPIALYELPYLDGQNDHYPIVNWQNVYRATDTLWMDSLSDKFTGNQLANPNSRLNKLGKKIAAAMSRKTGTKIYLHIVHDVPGRVQYDTIDGQIIRLCPGCGEPMEYVEQCSDYEIFVCDDCLLSSDLPDDYD